MFQGWRYEMTGRVAAAVVFVGVLALGSPGHAQDDLDLGGDLIGRQDAPNRGRVSFSAGFDVTNAYFFRGLLNEDQGFIFQPWADVTFLIDEGDDDLNDISLTFGIWNSFHSNQTGASSLGTEPDSWYESDIYIGVSAGVGADLTAGLTYTAYTSPNDAFATIQEIALALSYDDQLDWEESGLSEPGFSGLQPSITLAVELDNSVTGRDEGVYLEFGIAPSFTLIDQEDFPVFLTVPVKIGLSVDDYYQGGGANNDETFGYFDIGADLSMPLTCVGPDWGAWEMSLKVHVLFLAETTRAINNNDEFEVVGTFGMSMGY